MAVDILTEFESVVAALERDGISYAVCGGLAVTIHGHVRATERALPSLPDRRGEVFTVDVLLVTPVLADAWEGRERIEWHGHHVPTVSRSGLMAMKRLAGRLQDLADIEALDGGWGE